MTILDHIVLAIGLFGLVMAGVGLYAHFKK